MKSDLSPAPPMNRYICQTCVKAACPSRCDTCRYCIDYRPATPTTPSPPEPVIPSGPGRVSPPDRPAPPGAVDSPRRVAGLSGHTYHDVSCPSCGRGKFHDDMRVILARADDAIASADAYLRAHQRVEEDDMLSFGSVRGAGPIDHNAGAKREAADFLGDVMDRSHTIYGVLTVEEFCAIEMLIEGPSAPLVRTPKYRKLVAEDKRGEMGNELSGAGRESGCGVHATPGA